MGSSMVEPGSNLFFRRGFCPGSVISVGGSVFSGLSPTTNCPIGSPIIDNETPFQFSERRSSPTFGGFLGYTIQFGSVVIGGEGDAAWKRGETSAALPTESRAIYNLVPPGFSVPTAPIATASRSELFTGTVRQGWDSSLRTRFGFLATPSTLVYGTAGVAFGEVSGSFSYNARANYTSLVSTASGPFSPFSSAGPVQTDTVSGAASWHDTRVGWTAGGGVETEIWPGMGWKLRLEYRHTDFGRYSKDIPLTRGTSCPSGATPVSAGPVVSSGTCAPNLGSTNAHLDLRASFETVRVGLGYSFSSY